MSKTDKDKPYAIRAQQSGIERHQHRDWRGNELECDLYSTERDRRMWGNNCTYVLSRHYPHGMLGSVPSWFVREVYHRPQRRVVHDTLHMAARDYNANGDTELEPEPVQGRGSARWLWW